LRRILALALAGAALAVPAAAHAAPKPAGLAITHVQCIETEDITGADDAYLKSGSARIWGPVSLNNGEGADLRVTVHSGQVVELWDEDSPDPDDFLGSNTINGPGVYKYNLDDANYDVTVSAT
jgi:hypothetical protein